MCCLNYYLISYLYCFLQFFLLYSYGKTKESFGWPDDVDEFSNNIIYGPTSNSSVLTTNQYNSQEKELPLTGFTIEHLDK